MQIQHIKLLEEAAQSAAETFSNRTEEIGKRTGIKFSVEAVLPLSEETGTVTFKKSDGTRALGFFYLLKYKNMKKFNYFFPTDSHITGMQAFGQRKAVIEEANYSFRKIIGEIYG